MDHERPAGELTVRGLIGGITQEPKCVKRVGLFVRVD